jgi:hypothetical protein
MKRDLAMIKKKRIAQYGNNKIKSNKQRKQQFLIDSSFNYNQQTYSEVTPFL